jgi:hypothetical protein
MSETGTNARHAPAPEAARLPDEATVVCPPEVLSRFLDDGDAVLLHLGTGTYFGANEVAALALKEMGSGATLAHLEATIAGRYDAPRQLIRHDLEELIAQLAEKKLVTVRLPQRRE